jgi:GNAT superfamily N-acetyltransferase
MSLTVRKYTSEDAPALRRIFLDARRFAFSWAGPETFDLTDFDLVTQGESILVAVENGSPKGFIAWWPPENFVHSLFVDPAFIGKGAGKLLLNAGLAEMGRPATLKCLQANVNALNFYLAQHWKVAGQGESADGNYYLLAID